MHNRPVAGVLALMAACATTPGAAQRPVFGEWRVAGSTCPGECALSRTEAEAWRGRILTYSDTLARFGEHSCRRPHHLVGYWPASGVYGGAHLKDLGIAKDSAMVVEVQCPAQSGGGPDPRWQAPGSFLIIKDRDHLLMVWEGVYFELIRRTRS